ncbi:toll/interleukin-1 receptor domain-containing protein [bacterium]|nr:toll/interleukin-1 receptor domain-containing protein [bacterium]
MSLENKSAEPVSPDPAGIVRHCGSGNPQRRGTKNSPRAGALTPREKKSRNHPLKNKHIPIMANPEHVEIVRLGAKAINEWRQENPGVRLDLSGADFSNTQLFDADISRANISSANFEGSKLFKVDLSKANLSSATLVGARVYRTKCHGADFSKAFLNHALIIGFDFSEANFTHANLNEAKIVGGSLYKANFENSFLLETTCESLITRETYFAEAHIGLTLFADCDLRGAIDLDKVNHVHPSTIGIDTILRSEGDIPPEFLRGCGLPDRVIDYVKSLAITPIQFYSCFISHSSKDEPFPKHLFDKLQGAGVRCWYFPEHARTGEKLRDEIEGAIKLYDKLVVICSANSLSSQPVVDEIQEALQEEKAEAIQRLKDHDRVNNGELSLQDFENRRYRTRILFPIMIDDYLLKHWKHHLQVELSERVVADFRGWENFDKFDKEFKKLLKDLNEREES